MYTSPGFLPISGDTAQGTVSVEFREPCHGSSQIRDDAVVGTHHLEIPETPPPFHVSIQIYHTLQFDWAGDSGLPRELADMVLELGKDAVPAPSPRRKQSELLVCHGLEFSGTVLRLGPRCEESGLRDADTVIGLAVPSAPLTRACAAGLGAPGQGSGPSSGSSTPYKTSIYSAGSDHAGVASGRAESKARGDEHEHSSSGRASTEAGAPAPSRRASVPRCVVAGARTPVATVPVWALWKHPSSSSWPGSGSGSPPAGSSRGAFSASGAGASDDALGLEHRHRDPANGVLPPCLPPPFGGAPAMFPGLEVAAASGDSSVRGYSGAAAASAGDRSIGSPMLRHAGRGTDKGRRHESPWTEPERTFLLLRSIRPLLRAQEAVRRCIGCVGRLRTAVVLGADLPGGFEAVQLLAGRGTDVLAVATGAAGREALRAAWETSSGAGTGVTIGSTGMPSGACLEDADADADAGANDGQAGEPGSGAVGYSKGKGKGQEQCAGSSRGAVGAGSATALRGGPGEGEQEGGHAARRSAALLEAATAAGKALEPSALAPQDAAVSALAAAMRSVGEGPGRVVVGRSVLHPGVTSAEATVGEGVGASERKVSGGGASCDECDPLAALVEALEWTGGVGVDALVAVSMQPEEDEKEYKYEEDERERPDGRSVRPLVAVPPLGEMLGCVCPGGCIALAPTGRGRSDERSGCASTVAAQDQGREEEEEEEEDEDEDGDYMDPEDMRLAMRKGVTLGFVDERSLLLSGCRVGRLAGMVEQGLRLVATGRVVLAPAYGLRVRRE